MKSERCKIISEKIFNKWGKTYDKSIWMKWIITWIPSILAEMKEVKNPSILDVGCGTGEVLYRLLELQPKFVGGVDISKEMIEEARKKFKDGNAEFKIGDAESLSWPDGTFNYVILTGSFHHFPNPHILLEEINRVLKARGFLIVADPHLFPCIREIYNLLLRFYPYKGDYYLYSQRELKNLFIESGFSIVAQKKIGFMARLIKGQKR